MFQSENYDRGGGWSCFLQSFPEQPIAIDFAKSVCGVDSLTEVVDLEQEKAIYNCFKRYAETEIIEAFP